MPCIGGLDDSVRSCGSDRQFPVRDIVVRAHADSGPVRKGAEQGPGLGRFRLDGRARQRNPARGQRAGAVEDFQYAGCTERTISDNTADRRMGHLEIELDGIQISIAVHDPGLAAGIGQAGPADDTPVHAIPFGRIAVRVTGTAVDGGFGYTAVQDIKAAVLIRIGITDQAGQAVGTGNKGFAPYRATVNDVVAAALGNSASDQASYAVGCAAHLHLAFDDAAVQGAGVKPAHHAAHVRFTGNFRGPVNGTVPEQGGIGFLHIADDTAHAALCPGDNRPAGDTAAADRRFFQQARDAAAVIASASDRTAGYGALLDAAGCHDPAADGPDILGGRTDSAFGDGAVRDFTAFHLAHNAAHLVCAAHLGSCSQAAVPDDGTVMRIAHKSAGIVIGIADFDGGSRAAGQGTACHFGHDTAGDIYRRGQLPAGDMAAGDGAVAGKTRQPAGLAVRFGNGAVDKGQTCDGRVFGITEEAAGGILLVDAAGCKICDGLAASVVVARKRAGSRSEGSQLLARHIYVCCLDIILPGIVRIVRLGSQHPGKISKVVGILDQERIRVDAASFKSGASGDGLQRRLWHPHHLAAGYAVVLIADHTADKASVRAIGLEGQSPGETALRKDKIKHRCRGAERPRRFQFKKDAVTGRMYIGHDGPGNGFCLVIGRYRKGSPKRLVCVFVGEFEGRNFLSVASDGKFHGTYGEFH